MSKYGIKFNSPAIEKSDAAVPQTILARMNELKMQGCEVIIYILNQVGDDIYHAIKFFGNVKLGKNRFYSKRFILTHRNLHERNKR
jgi:hypothetical protein